MVNNKYVKYHSEYTTQHFSCDNCPAKLFSIEDDNIIKKGIGNINSNTIIVYPTYISINHKLFDKLTDIITDAYYKKYNYNILDTIYITPCIKCFCKDTMQNTIKTIYNKCSIKTVSEIVKHRCHKKVIFIGDSVELNCIMPMNITSKHIPCPYTIFNNDGDKEKFLQALLPLL